jgi:ankyrin repeat protein
MLNMEPPAANALHHAARCGDVEKFETLLNIGANIAAVDNEGRTCLHHAVLCGHLPICEAVVRHGHSGLLLAKDLLSCTPFHLAAVQNQVQFILCLVKALCKDHPTDTPLHYIASRGCMQVNMPFPLAPP